MVQQPLLPLVLIADRLHMGPNVRAGAEVGAHQAQGINGADLVLAGSDGPRSDTAIGWTYNQ